MKKKKKVKSRLKFKKKPILILLGTIILFTASVFYLYHLPMKRIIIENLEYLHDRDIIEIAGLKDYPNIFHLKKNEVKKTLEANAYIDSVQIYRDIFGNLTVRVKENKPLFYNRYTKKVVHANGQESTENFIGLPILNNFVQEDEYKRFIAELNKIDYSIVQTISEIIFNPWKTEDKIIDNTRFLLLMNDGNKVEINLINMEKLNNYFVYYARVPEGKTASIQLDSQFESVVVTIN